MLRKGLFLRTNECPTHADSFCRRALARQKTARLPATNSNATEEGSGTSVVCSPKVKVGPAPVAVMLHVPAVSANPVTCATPVPSRSRKFAFWAEITTDVASKLYNVPPAEKDQRVKGEAGEGLKVNKEKVACVPGVTSEYVPVAPERTPGLPVPSGPKSKEKSVAVSSEPLRFAPPTNSIVPVIEEAAARSGEPKATMANPITPVAKCLSIGYFIRRFIRAISYRVSGLKSSQNRSAGAHFFAQ